MQYIFLCNLYRRRSRGATLVESLVTLAIAGVLGALAVPPLSQLVEQVRESNMASTFMASVYRTRNEAISRNARVVMCKSANGLSCTATGGWEQGWIVFHDANNNASLEPDEELLQVQTFTGSKLRLSGNSPVAAYLSFTGLGLPKVTTGEFQAGSWILCSLSAAPVQGRKLVLSKPGNLRSSKIALEQCG